MNNDQRFPGAVARAVAKAVVSHSVVLVEGVSDQFALEAIAERRGRDLHGEGISIVPMDGVTNIGHFLQMLGPRGSAVRLGGLYDAGGEGDVRRGLECAGLGAKLTNSDIEALGFYVCVADLEDELIRSLGARSVQEVIDAQGELRSFRTMQRQPAQQGRSVDEQLRRFMGTRGGRKIRYGRLLVNALDLAKVPLPLDQVLAHV